MSISLLLAALLAWIVVGFAVAYLFGRFIHATDTPDGLDEPHAPIVSYLRPRKRSAQPRTARERAAKRLHHGDQ
jgi:hypothetical protein